MPSLLASAACARCNQNNKYYYSKLNSTLKNVAIYYLCPSDQYVVRWHARREHIIAHIELEQRLRQQTRAAQRWRIVHRRRFRLLLLLLLLLLLVLLASLLRRFGGRWRHLLLLLLLLLQSDECSTVRVRGPRRAKHDRQ